MFMGAQMPMALAMPRRLCDERAPSTGRPNKTSQEWKPERRGGQRAYTATSATNRPGATRLVLRRMFESAGPLAVRSAKGQAMYPDSTVTIAKTRPAIVVSSELDLEVVE